MRNRSSESSQSGSIVGAVGVGPVGVGAVGVGPVGVGPVGVGAVGVGAAAGFMVGVSYSNVEPKAKRNVSRCQLQNL